MELGSPPSTHRRPTQRRPLPNNTNEFNTVPTLPFALSGDIGPPIRVDATVEVPPDFAPTFIVGCGRSGTTLLGELLSQHREVAYLNEARRIWIDAVPQTDIWSVQALPMLRNGRLNIDPNSVDPTRMAHLRSVFHAQWARIGRPHLVEKLPENAFRIPFLRAAFPAARIVHVVRDGRAVAKSIARFNAADWYGPVGALKWQALVQSAVEMGVAASASDLASFKTMLERALVEWTLSILAARKSMAELRVKAESERHSDSQGSGGDTGGGALELRFEDLVARPAPVLAELQRFLALEDDADWGFICAQIVDPARASKKRTLDRFAFPAHTLERTRTLLAELGYVEEEDETEAAAGGAAGEDAVAEAL